MYQDRRQNHPDHPGEAGNTPVGGNRKMHSDILSPLSEHVTTPTKAATAKQTTETQAIEPEEKEKEKRTINTPNPQDQASLQNY